MVTLKDVAEASGVSTATVSYVVIGGPRSILPATREKVLKAIQELGYHPHAAARSLMGKRTQTFGVVFPHVVRSPLDNQYFALVLSGIMDASTERKQMPMLFTGFSWDEAEKSVPLFCDGRCDGFLFVAPPPNSQLIETLISRKTPVVVIGTRFANVRVASVDVDNVHASRLATERLIELGHRKIGLFHSTSPSSSIPERIQGFKIAVTDAGIPESDAAVFSFHHPEELPADVAYGFLSSERGKDLTAVVCTHDSTAIGVIQAAERLGLRVPEDLSVFGFDDLPIATTNAPPLSTVRQPLRKIGARASNLLFDLCESPETEPLQILFPVDLVERHSSGPALNIPRR